MEALILAIGFVCIFEGFMPMVAPKQWQETLRQIVDLDSQLVRNIAIVVVCIGLAIVWSVGLMG